MEMAQQSLNEVFCTACGDLMSRGNAQSINVVLGDLAQNLARDGSARVAMGTLEPSIWPGLRELWRTCVLDLDSERTVDESTLNSLVLAKFTRNLVAGVQHNQKEAYANEPYISDLIYRSTSAINQQDEAARLNARMLTQALSNMTTGYDDLASQFLNKHLHVPEERNILLRLLGCQDVGIVTSVFVLVLNDIHENRERTSAIISTPIGIKVCIGILDQIAIASQSEDSTESSKAFEIGYAISTQVMKQGAVPVLFRKLAVQDEVTTPHQTTLLKLLDSFLQSSGRPLSPSLLDGLIPFLSEQLLALSQYARKAINRSLGSQISSTTPPTANGEFPTEAASLNELDLLLPKVCEALVLVLQSLITISLDLEHDSTNADTTRVMADCLHHSRSNDDLGMVESIIDLLRLLDLFLPRIMFGKVVTPGHASGQTADSTGFPYLKRDIVRFLGIVSHNSRDIQDRVRVCGGIPVVMNMCVIDDQNPYLREHAIFALRNILHGNANNQAVVNDIKPMGEWGPDGVLRDLPGAVRR